MEKNTFGNYKFDNWVPKDLQESIKSFRGCFGRTHKDWLKASKEQDERDICYHIPCAGFGMPKYGTHVFYLISSNKSNKEETVYKRIEGKYIHKWNNLGVIINNDGGQHHVSTCNIWCPIVEKHIK